MIASRGAAAGAPAREESVGNARKSPAPNRSVATPVSENDRLSIKGDRPFSAAARREDFHRIERSHGRFSRSFALPRTLNHSEVRAELKNGVLEVVLPKKAETQARQIRVDMR